MTLISFEVPEVARVSVRMSSSSGHMIRTLLDAEVGPGRYTVDWDGTDNHAQAVASAVYFIQLQAGERSPFAKAVLAKQVRKARSEKIRGRTR